MIDYGGLDWIRKEVINRNKRIQMKGILKLFNNQYGYRSQPIETVAAFQNGLTHQNQLQGTEWVPLVQTIEG